jgi:hypothetical protein
MQRLINKCVTFVRYCDKTLGLQGSREVNVSFPARVVGTAGAGCGPIVAPTAGRLTHLIAERLAYAMA